MQEHYFAFIPQTTVNSKELNALPVTARWVYIVMIAEDHGYYAPFQISYRHIHEITGFSVSTISRAIVALAGAGFLTYEHGGLEQNPNIYALESDWLKT